MDFPGWREHSPWDIFTQLDFYNPPFLLEEVDDSEILGCHISTEQRSITFRQPVDLVTLRSGHSQDSDIAILSAFRARALLIMRYVFPTTLIIPQLEDLIAIFDRKNIDRSQLTPTLRTILKFLRRRFNSDSRTYHIFRHKITRLFMGSDERPVTQTPRRRPTEKDATIIAGAKLSPLEVAGAKPRTPIISGCADFFFQFCPR